MGWLTEARTAHYAPWIPCRLSCPQTMYFPAPMTVPARDIAVAPNGHTIAVVAYLESARKNAIWTYEVGSPGARSLDDTAGAIFPFWSPHGRTGGILR